MVLNTSIAYKCKTISNFMSNIFNVLINNFAYKHKFIGKYSYISINNFKNAKITSLLIYNSKYKVYNKYTLYNKYKLYNKHKLYNKYKLYNRYNSYILKNNINKLNKGSFKNVNIYSYSRKIPITHSVITFSAYPCYRKRSYRKFTNVKLNRCSYVSITNKLNYIYNKYNTPFILKFNLYKNVFNTKNIVFNRQCMSIFLTGRDLLNSIINIYYRSRVFNKTNLSCFNNFNILKKQKKYNIKKIKYKPGYIKIWKNARLLLSKILNLTVKKQSKLSKFLIKLNKYNKLNLLIFFETSLINTLLKSKILPEYNSIYFFIRNNLVTLNSVIISKIDVQLHVNDFIQLILTYKYFILYKWLYVFTNIYKFKIKFSIKKMLLLIKKKYDTNKLPKHTQNSKLLFYKNNQNDVPLYIELDYNSLSFFILYNFYLYNSFFYHIYSHYKLNIFNMYNWKYIT